MSDNVKKSGRNTVWWKLLKMQHEKNVQHKNM